MDVFSILTLTRAREKKERNYIYNVLRRYLVKYIVDRPPRFRNLQKMYLFIDDIYIYLLNRTY